MVQMVLLPLLVSFFLSLLFTPLGIWFARRFNLIDDPRTHKHPAILHRRPVPRAGGLSMYSAIFICFLLFFPMFPQTILLLFSSFLVVVVGLLDDRFDLSPYVRFGMNILSAAIVVASGVSIPFVTDPLGGILHFSDVQIGVFGAFSLPLDRLFAIVWIVWVMNMLNWSKGVDGQMPGIAAISAIIIGIASLRFASLEVAHIHTAQMAFLVAGVSLGFLPFNFYPAKIFPGYSATVLGFLIGVLSLLSSVKLATAVLVMGVPMTDAIITIIRRVVAKRSPFWHDREHLHHLLLHFGLSQRLIALLYWLVSAVLGVLALSLSSKGKMFAIIGVSVVVTSIILYLRSLVRKNAHHH